MQAESQTVLHASYALLCLARAGGGSCGVLVTSSLLLSSLELVIHKSMSLKYEPSSEPIHISAK